MKDFSISLSIKEAFRGFAKWWLVLCIISFGILISQSWIPKYILHHSAETKMLQAYYNSFKIFKKNITNISSAPEALNNLQNKLLSISLNHANSEEFSLFLMKLAIGFLIFFLILCLLYTFTIIFSKASVSKNKDRKEIKRELKKSHSISLSYLFLSLIKVLPFCIGILIPFLFLVYKLFFSSELYMPLESQFFEWLSCIFLTIFMFIFGIYLYIKLYFTGFVITESTANPFNAIKISWGLTTGVFGKIFIIFLILLVVDIIAIITIVGFIPLNSIKYTLRASIYRQLVESSI